jgi:hypothetical protein
MADVLSPQDRALIDAALAAGRVTVVPRGVSGLVAYVCDPATGKLVRDDGSAAAPSAKVRRRSVDPRAGQRAARLHKLRALLERGASRDEIDALYAGMSATALFRDLSALGMTLPARAKGRRVARDAA